MKLHKFLLGLSFAGALMAQDAPQITAITDAAKFSKSVAGGSYTTIFGTNLATKTGVNGQVPFSRNLEGTEVLENGEPAPLHYVSDGQINYISRWQQGTVNVTVRKNGVESAVYKLELQPDSIGFFQRGPRRAAVILADGQTVMDKEHPLPTQDTIISIYANGGGPTDPGVQPGVPVEGLHYAQQPIATIEGTPVTVEFAGFTPTCANLNQYNIRTKALPQGFHTLSFTLQNSSDKTDLFVANPGVRLFDAFIADAEGTQATFAGTYKTTSTTTEVKTTELGNLLTKDNGPGTMTIDQASGEYAVMSTAVDKTATRYMLKRVTDPTVLRSYTPKPWCVNPLPGADQYMDCMLTPGSEPLDNISALQYSSNAPDGTIDFWQFQYPITLSTTNDSLKSCALWEGFTWADTSDRHIAIGTTGLEYDLPELTTVPVGSGSLITKFRATANIQNPTCTKLEHLLWHATGLSHLPTSGIANPNPTGTLTPFERIVRDQRRTLPPDTNLNDYDRRQVTRPL